MKMAKLHPVHPGEILTEDFLNPMGLTAYAVAARLDLPRTRIERLARGETRLTADTALRLGRFFGVSAAFWMNIQARYDLERAADDVESELASITPYRPAAA
jgi:addiction module HigA family antidote